MKLRIIQKIWTRKNGLNQRFLSKTKKAAKPRVFIKSDGTAFRFNAVNPYPIPVQMEVTSQSIGESPLLTLIPPNKTILLYTVENATEKPRFKYRYVIGRPIDQYENVGYYPPVPQGQKFKISQAFGGKFSHTAKSSFYAVDIAMPVGTCVRAARSGVVVTVKDDYHMGGTMDKKFFRDKANAIIVVHSDGTFASYVHLLLGSAVVKPGDTVEAGQILARAGSSGYSSGPHLHFVVRKNSSMELESVKFFFRDREGQNIHPIKGEFVEGY